jgi:hypothetical protein
MKKLFIIAAFVVAASLTASFGLGRIEIRARPVSDQQYSNSQYREIEQQRRYAWQRDRWEGEQQRRAQRHQQSESYEWWLRTHSRDYDNRRGN